MIRTPARVFYSCSNQKGIPMRIFRNRAFGAVLLVVALVLAACGSDDAGSGEDVADGPTITVTSFNFSESVILAEIYAQAMEDNGYPVDASSDAGPFWTRRAWKSGSVRYAGGDQGLMPIRPSLRSRTVLSARSIPTGPSRRGWTRGTIVERPTPW